MHDAKHAYYLHCLGIEQWRYRSSPIVLATPWMILTHEPSVKENCLLQKIFHAVQIAAEDVRIRSFIDESPLRQELTIQAPNVIMVLGEKIAQSFLKTQESLAVLRTTAYVYQNIPVMVSYSLSDLLACGRCKSQAYQDWICAKNSTLREE